MEQNAAFGLRKPLAKHKSAASSIQGLGLQTHGFGFGGNGNRNRQLRKGQLLPEPDGKDFCGMLRLRNQLRKRLDRRFQQRKKTFFIAE